MKIVKTKINHELNLDIIQELTNKLEGFQSEILLINQNQEANCKSLINLLAIGIMDLTTLEFKIHGKDEDDVVEFIKSFFN